MARIDTLINFLTDVAAAIKAKKGDSTSIPAADFDTEIANLPSGDDTMLISLIDRTATSFEIPEGTTSIGVYAFFYCLSLASIIIPDGVTLIGEGAFGLCTSLTSITIPDSVTSIGDSAFSGCTGLTSVTIGNGVTSILGYAFSGCTGLTSVTIGNGVTSIDDGAFEDCTNLTEIDFSTHTTVPTLISTNAFSNTSASLVIKVPSALVDEWKAATNWATYADKIVGVRL